MAGVTPRSAAPSTSGGLGLRVGGGAELNEAGARRSLRRASGTSALAPGEVGVVLRLGVQPRGATALVRLPGGQRKLYWRSELSPAELPAGAELSDAELRDIRAAASRKDASGDSARPDLAASGLSAMELTRVTTVEGSCTSGPGTDTDMHPPVFTSQPPSGALPRSTAPTASPQPELDGASLLTSPPRAMPRAQGSSPSPVPSRSSVHTGDRDDEAERVRRRRSVELAASGVVRTAAQEQRRSPTPASSHRTPRGLATPQRGTQQRSALQSAPRGPAPRAGLESTGSRSPTPGSPPPRAPDPRIGRFGRSPPPGGGRASPVPAEETSAVHVLVRVRPETDAERARPHPQLQQLGPLITPSPDSARMLYARDPASAFQNTVAFECDGALVGAGQEEVYETAGRPVLTAALRGFNACVLAYGQTGSGKTYTMLGEAQQPGLMPRLCESIFDAIAADGARHCQVAVSFMEIYMEKVRDLLAAKQQGAEFAALRVRQHPVTGVFVDGVRHAPVGSAAECARLFQSGARQRATAATSQNERSSRSHAIFTLRLTFQEQHRGGTSQRTSSVNLVDLAGSERVGKGQASGRQMDEGNQINLSLTVLRKVIDGLIERGRGRQTVVPVRESMLTWVLSDSLGGNAKTTIIATVSPVYDNAEETVATLRYAVKARGIVSVARVNQSSHARLARELEAEIEALRRQAAATVDDNEALQDQIRLTEAAMLEVQKAARELEQEHRRTQDVMEEERTMRLDAESERAELLRRLRETELRLQLAEAAARPTDRSTVLATPTPHSPQRDPGANGSLTAPSAVQQPMPPDTAGGCAQHADHLSARLRTLAAKLRNAQVAHQETVELAKHLQAIDETLAAAEGRLPAVSTIVRPWQQRGSSQPPSGRASGQCGQQ